MNYPRTVAIIQARRASSRLPDKVLLDIAGQPMLAHVFERARRASTLDAVVVATTTDPSDDAIEALCQARRYPCFRGSMYDVLDRYYQAARTYKAEVIVRLTADCPLIDPGLIDETRRLIPAPGSGSPSFAANRLPPPWKRSYPIGLDVEVCTFEALETAWREADQPHQREHVMPFIYENAMIETVFLTVEGRKGQLPVISYQLSVNDKEDLHRSASHVIPYRQRFHARLLDYQPEGPSGAEGSRSYGSLRWTVDTTEDLELVRQVFAHFPGREFFSWLEVLELFERCPELAEINAGVQHKSYQDVDARAPDKDRQPKR